MEQENKLIKTCKKCNNTYVIGSDDILLYQSIDSELVDYCSKCRFTSKRNIEEKKSWCHNPLK